MNKRFGSAGEKLETERKCRRRGKRARILKQKVGYTTKIGTEGDLGGTSNLKDPEEKRTYRTGIPRFKLQREGQTKDCENERRTPYLSVQEATIDNQ